MLDTASPGISCLSCMMGLTLCVADFVDSYETGIVILLKLVKLCILSCIIDPDFLSSQNSCWPFYLHLTIMI